MTETSFDILPSAPKAAAELDVSAIWQRAGRADPKHPYLARYDLPSQHLRQIGEHLVAPLMGLDGKLDGLRLVNCRGDEDVYPAAIGEACFVLEDDCATRTIIVEGSVADALAIHASTAARVLQVSTPSDALKLQRSLSADDRGRQVLVAFSSSAGAADSSPVGERLTHVVAPPPNVSWAELYGSGGTSTVKSWLDDPAFIFGGVVVPEHIAIRPSGLWTCFNGNCSSRLGGPIIAMALAHDEAKKNWQRVIYMHDRDGNDRHLYVPEQHFSLAPQKVIAALIGAGFEIRPDRGGQIVRDLGQTSVAKRLVVVTRPGWQGQHYVGSGGTIGPRLARMPVLAGSVGAAPLVEMERLEHWQGTIGRYAEGNSRLVAALGIALGGIAIGLFEAQPGIGLHLRGLSSLGKTTALRVAASVFGPANREIQSWSATDSGLETLAVRHHHRALMLDELAQVRPEAAAQAAYLLANGSGRQRANGSGRALPTAQWQLTFLSSGEISLEEKVAERSGAPLMREGQAVRLIDLPAEAGCGHGIYENLHGHISGAALSDALNRATEASMDDIAVKYARAIADDIEQARAFLISEREFFVRKHLPAEADGIVGRVYSNFGFLAAATELATQKGILPWSRGSGHTGIDVCAQAWFAAWGNRSDTSETLAVARAWLAAKVGTLTPWQVAAKDAAGIGYFCRERKNFYLKATGWRSLCGEVDSADMQAALGRLGAFRYTNARPPKGYSGKYYIIDASVVGDGRGQPE